MRRLLTLLAGAVLLLLLTSGAALAAGEGGGPLPAGAIVGLVVSVIIAGGVVALSLGYILPKPPGR
ncbi:MAG: hypothetical protein F4Y94_06600 [Chloroflexi bacterium]|nr:hypothetical protein [Chloroflexota bacterium]